MRASRMRSCGRIAAGVRTLLAQGANVNAGAARRHDGAALGRAHGRCRYGAAADLKAGAKVECRHPLRRHAALPCQRQRQRRHHRCAAPCAARIRTPPIPGGETALDDRRPNRQGRCCHACCSTAAPRVNARESVRGQTALMWAVLENHPAVVRLLLARGADVNAQTKVEHAGRDDRRAAGDLRRHRGPWSRHLSVARRAEPVGRDDAAALCGERRQSGDGAHPAGRPGRHRTGPRPTAPTRSSSPSRTIISSSRCSCVDKGADVNAADPFYKRTPLFAAVERRNPDFTRDTRAAGRRCRAIRWI